MCTVSGAGAKLLQTARNAAAHHNHQSLGELLNLSSAFSAFPINHACQSVFWVETVSADYLLPFVLEELKDAAVYAVL